MLLALPHYWMNSPTDADRGVRTFQVRDALAMQLLMAPLADEGFSLGPPLLGFPPPDGREPPDRAHVDLSMHGPGSAVVAVTRPAIDDEVEGHRRRIPRAYTDLEDLIFAAWRPYLSRVSRSHVTLDRSVWPRLPEAYRSRRDMCFYMIGRGSPYRRFNSCDGSGWRNAPRAAQTAGFVLRTSELYPGGPGLVHAWAPDGDATLILAWLLSYRRRDLLLEPGFRLVELRGDEFPDRPFDLHFIDERWKLEELLFQPE